MNQFKSFLAPLSCIRPFVSKKDTPKVPVKYSSDEEGEVDEAVDGDVSIFGIYNTLAAANLYAGAIYLECKKLLRILLCSFPVLGY